MKSFLERVNNLVNEQRAEAEPRSPAAASPETSNRSLAETNHKAPEAGEEVKLNVTRYFDHETGAFRGITFGDRKDEHIGGYWKNSDGTTVPLNPEQAQKLHSTTQAMAQRGQRETADINDIL